MLFLVLLSAVALAFASPIPVEGAEAPEALVYIHDATSDVADASTPAAEAYVHDVTGDVAEPYVHVEPVVTAPAVTYAGYPYTYATYPYLAAGAYVVAAPAKVEVKAADKATRDCVAATVLPVHHVVAPDVTEVGCTGRDDHDTDAQLTAGHGLLGAGDAGIGLARHGLAYAAASTAAVHAPPAHHAVAAVTSNHVVAPATPVGATLYIIYKPSTPTFEANFATTYATAPGAIKGDQAVAGDNGDLKEGIYDIEHEGSDQLRDQTREESGGRSVKKDTKVLPPLKTEN